MMPWFDWSSFIFPQNLQKRLVAFLFQRGLGQFLQDDIDIDRLNVQLSEGVAEIHNIALNSEAINDTLSGSFIPFRIKHGFIARIRAKIPWKNPLVGDYEIQIHDVCVTLVPNFQDKGHDGSVKTELTESIIMTSSTVLAKDFIQEQQDLLKGSTVPSLIDNEQADAMNPTSPSLFSKVIERILDNLCISITQMNLKIEFEENISCLSILIPSLHIENERNTLMQPAMDELSPAKLEAVTKIVVIDGLEITLTLPFSDGESTSMTSSTSLEYSAVEQSVYLDAYEDAQANMASMLLQQPTQARRILSHVGSSIQIKLKAYSELMTEPCQSYTPETCVSRHIAISLSDLDINVSASDISTLLHIFSSLLRAFPSENVNTQNYSKPLADQPVKDGHALPSNSPTCLDLPGGYITSISQLSNVIDVDVPCYETSLLPTEHLTVLSQADKTYLSLTVENVRLQILYDSIVGYALFSSPQAEASFNDTPMTSFSILLGCQHLLVETTSLPEALGCSLDAIQRNSFSISGTCQQVSVQAAVMEKKLSCIIKQIRFSHQISDADVVMSIDKLQARNIYTAIESDGQTYTIVTCVDAVDEGTEEVLVASLSRDRLTSNAHLQLENITLLVHQEQLPSWIETFRQILNTGLMHYSLMTKDNRPTGHTDASVLNVRVSLNDCSVKIIPKGMLSRVVLLFQNGQILIMPSSQGTKVDASAERIHILLIENTTNQRHSYAVKHAYDSLSYWKSCGYLPMLAIGHGHADAVISNNSNLNIIIKLIIRTIRFDACADSLKTLIFAIGAVIPAPEVLPLDPKNELERGSEGQSGNVDSKLDEDVFRPNSHFAVESNETHLVNELSIVEGYYDIESPHVCNGELESGAQEEDKVNVFDSEPLRFVDNFYAQRNRHIGTKRDFHANENGILVFVSIEETNIHLFDGYDWRTTRTKISTELACVRHQALMRQQQAGMQNDCIKNESDSEDDMSDAEASAQLFKSIYISVPVAEARKDIGKLEENLDKVINELPENVSNEIFPSRPVLGRSSVHKIRVLVQDIDAKYFISDTSQVIHQLASHLELRIHRIDIIDNLQTSTWRNFLSPMREDSRNVRESISSMAFIDLRNVRPTKQLAIEEARVRANIQPIRLHVDQDALEFVKRFFAFEPAENNVVHVSDPANITAPPTPVFIQYINIKPIRIKLDYKPKFVDYKALRGGQTTEMMNFFHFESAMMTLKEVSLSGIVGLPKLFNDLNDIWMPDIKATQLQDVIAGVSPIRSLVNIGTGFADLVLLPTEHYRKDGHVWRGIQKGTKSFAKATTMEALKLGSRLAAGTQVILERVEGILSVEGEQALINRVNFEGQSVLAEVGTYSKMADPPQSIIDGVHGAYEAFSTNMSSAAHTIFAVPIKTYQKSGPQGSLKAVVKAVPIAVIKPMIGASEAVTKTLLGLRNSIDPEERLNDEEKYKSRGI